MRRDYNNLEDRTTDITLNQIPYPPLVCVIPSKLFYQSENYGQETSNMYSNGLYMSKKISRTLLKHESNITTLLRNSKFELYYVA